VEDADLKFLRSGENVRGIDIPPRDIAISLVFEEGIVI
jgi:hypothetical protein